MNFAKKARNELPKTEMLPFLVINSYIRGVVLVSARKRHQLSMRQFVLTFLIPKSLNSTFDLVHAIIDFDPT